jgi:hypothetical protein
MGERCRAALLPGQGSACPDIGGCSQTIVTAESESATSDDGMVDDWVARDAAEAFTVGRSVGGGPDITPRKENADPEHLRTAFAASHRFSLLRWRTSAATHAEIRIDQGITAQVVENARSYV